MLFLSYKEVSIVEAVFMKQLGDIWVYIYHVEHLKYYKIAPVLG